MFIPQNTNNLSTLSHHPLLNAQKLGYPLFSQVPHLVQRGA
jgi:hypothetical protein